MEKKFNILRVKHAITLDNSCGCKIKSQFANVEVLFKQVPLSHIERFKTEVDLAHLYKLTKPDELINRSKFLNIQYRDLHKYYSDIISGDIMIFETL